MIVYAAPLRFSVWPTARGSAPKRFVQKAWLSTTTESRPRTSSSWGPKVRPTTARTPSRSK